MNKPSQTAKMPQPSPAPKRGLWAIGVILLALVSWAVLGKFAPNPKAPKKDNSGSNQQQKKETDKVSRTENKTGLKLVKIPAGSFLMGSNYQPDEQPIRRVTLSSFHMSKTEITVGQYKRYCEATGEKMPIAPDFNKGWSKLDHPIVRVSWDDAKGYCAWAGVLLPTETEWEYASRGGLEGKKYPLEDAWHGSKCANSVSPYKPSGTVPVGSYAANGYGLHDMSGNVWEWCTDWYSDKYNPSDTNNPQGSPTGIMRVLRGGSWFNTNPDLFRCAFRYFNYLLNPDGRSGDGGFRVVFRGLP